MEECIREVKDLTDEELRQYYNHYTAMVEQCNKKYDEARKDKYYYSGMLKEINEEIDKRCGKEKFIKGDDGIGDTNIKS